MHRQAATALYAMIALAAAGAFAIEYRALEAGMQGAGMQGVGAATGGPVVGLSLSSDRAALLGCSRALAPPLATLRPEAERAGVIARCSRAADRILRRSPGHGLAYFVIAQAADLKGEDAARDVALERSARLAPQEGWLAERRFVLALSSGVHASPEGTRLITREIAVLLSTQSGAELLARHVLHRPAARELVLAVARQAPERQQRRLANRIRIGLAAK